jgi:D-alanyl-D-alanine carboxypeptidase/D-alanyl-D-alanine-endopeptidase (penicillin-binding protein 4)
MRLAFVLLIASLLLAGCAPSALELTRPPHFAAALSRSPYPTLKSAIDGMIPDSLFPPSNVGIKVVSLRTGATLYDLNSTMLFNPASNQKLFTGATAHALLGPSFALNTIITLDTAAGIIGVRGQGDPVIYTRDLDSIAGMLAAQLPSRRYWTVVGDVSYFDDEYWGSGWTWDGEPDSYAMFLSPLILNNNTVQVRVSPASAPGDSVRVILDPPTAYVGLQIRARTVLDTAPLPLRITRKWRERSNTITVEGEIPLNGRTAVEDLSVWKPELYYVTVLGEALVRRGVPVNGVTVERTPARGPEVLRYTHRLDSALTFVEKVSDNLGAETFLKILGAELVGTPGSAENGIHVVHRYVSGIGVDTSRVSVADGSGLSRYNLTSPDAVIRLLTAIQKDSAHFASFHHTLPIAGVDGTIGRRMRGTRAEANLRAKTGTLSAVTALSGYVTTADGEMLAFSIMMQNFAENSRAYRAVQDRIGAYLAGLRRDQY